VGHDFETIEYLLKKWQTKFHFPVFNAFGNFCGVGLIRPLELKKLLFCVRIFDFVA
jgi:hypothetical protein